MKKFLYLLLPLLVLYSCQQKKPDFRSWYQQQTLDKTKSLSTSQAQPHTKAFYSSTLTIDTLYRSMQGPFEIKEIALPGKKEELVWIVAYQSEVTGAENNRVLDEKYMCHNNLNYARLEESPWAIKTSGKNSRIFTLSQGQTQFSFPEGYGIPIMAGQSLEMISQVLNHEEPELQLPVKHRASLQYIPESELSKPLKPLYQQSVFITKQIAGPAGKYGLPQSCAMHEHELDSSSLKGEQPKHDCSTEFQREDYDPYRDAYGRRYTGHWTLPFGREVLSTDVDYMLDLRKGTRIHAIGVHLHPYAEGLELWDLSIDSLLYSAEVEQAKEGMGFRSISYYSSKEGIPLYASHHYQLKSIYNCPDSSGQHTAMAVMYLYLADQ
jgi:hypothetical protein